MWDKARNAIETLYQDTAKVSIMQETVNAYGISEFAPVVLHDNIPCRISNKGNNAGKYANTNDNVTSGLVLYCAPEIDIPEGSRIVVTRNGYPVEYKRSGRTMRYNTHQQIEIDKIERA